jgi:NAD-dependent deacetylase
MWPPRDVAAGRSPSQGQGAEAPLAGCTKAPLLPAETITTDLVPLVTHARNIVALTGAGLSTAAGIPDFRGPQGLYVTCRYDPEKTFELSWFRREPEHFFRFAADFCELLARLRPTFAHAFLARLEAAGRLSAVITQNIDMLHQSAGSRTVIELHGSPATATCTACGCRLAALNAAWWRQAMAQSRRAPVVFCPECSGVLKPDIVFCGEQVQRYAEAERAVAGCDLLLVLGTSLTVYPAALLPERTAAPIIAVALGEVSLAPSPRHLVVSADLDAFCRELAGQMGLAAGES